MRIIIVDNKATVENINKLFEELKKPTNKILKVIIENIQSNKITEIEKLWNNIFETRSNKIDFNISISNLHNSSIVRTINKQINIIINKTSKINIFELDNIELNNLDITIKCDDNNENVEILIANCNIDNMSISGNHNINNKKVKITIYNSIIDTIQINNNNIFIVFNNCKVPYINCQNNNNNILHLIGGNDLYNFSFRDVGLSDMQFEELKFKNVDIVDSNRSLSENEQQVIIKCKNLIFDNYQDKNNYASINKTFYDFHYEKLILIEEYPKYLKINYKSLKTIDRSKTKLKKHKFIKKHNIDRNRLRRIKII